MEKVKDMASKAKEKVMECSAKVEGKVDETMARTPEGREAARQRAKAKEAGAKSEYHEEKAKHQEQAAGHHYGMTPGHVPFIGHHNHGVGSDTIYSSMGRPHYQGSVDQTGPGPTYTTTTPPGPTYTTTTTGLVYANPTGGHLHGERKF